MAVTPELEKLIRLHVRTFLKKEDADGDGKLSHKDFLALFDRYDEDRDGSLDRNELVGAARGVIPVEDVKTDQTVITFLRDHDASKDGNFSREEAKVLFGGADGDEDGALDENELVKAVARLVPPPPDDRPSETPRVEAKEPRVGTREPGPRRLGRLVGLRVLVPGGDPLGQVVDVVVGEDGRVAYVIVQDRAGLVAVPWGVVALGEKAVAVNVRVTAQALRQVAFAQDRYPDFASEQWLRGVRAAWGEQALRPWGPDRPLVPSDDRAPARDRLPPNDVPPLKDNVPLKDSVPPRDKDRPARRP